MAELCSVLSLLIAIAVVQLLDLINRSQPYEDKEVEVKQPRRIDRVATLVPRQATAALAQFFAAEGTEESATVNFYRVLPSILMRIGASSGITRGDHPMG